MTTDHHDDSTASPDPYGQGPAATSDAESATIPLVSRGQWTAVPDPVPRHIDDWSEALAAAGYIAFPISLGDPDAGRVVLDISPRAGGSKQRPQFHVTVVIAGQQFCVLADDIVDLMDLLHRWAPVVQTADTITLLTKIAAPAEASFDGNDVVAQLAARAAFGNRSESEWSRAAVNWRPPEPARSFEAVLNLRHNERP